MMAYTVDQVEKHTIVLRLAVAIYKMSEVQLARLLDALARQPDAAFAQCPDPTFPKSETMQRQMMIARIFMWINQLDKAALLKRLRLLNDAGFRWAREYPRLPCLLLVDFAANGKAYRSCIRDISATGVFIETSERFAEGQPLALCFTLSEANESMPFKVKGRVTHLYHEGIGVQYDNITHYQREIIAALIKKINSPRQAAFLQ